MSANHRTVLLLENMPDEATPFFGFIERNGFRYEVVKAYEHTPLPPADSYAAIVSTGGIMGVYDMDQPEYTYLRRQTDYLVDAVEEGVPVLGVCLGHQLLAHALGGEVVRADAPEQGWLEVDLTEAGQRDPLFEGLGAHPVFLQYHYDEVVALPEGATLLARSAMIPHQSFRVGDRPAWGIQFHPEYSPQKITPWILRDREKLARRGLDADAMIARGHEVYGPQNERIFENFFDAVKMHWAETSPASQGA